jgi:hypothetical protein
MEFGATHSSSQRPSDTIGNTPPPSCQSSLVTPAGPPPPAGVIILRKAHGFHPESPPHVRPPAQRFRKYASPMCGHMRGLHGCHSHPALPPEARAGYIKPIGRVTISSSQRPRQDWQPLLLPGCQSISATPAGSPPPAGVVFFAPHPNSTAWRPLPL